jgi:hypothetical protein
VIRSGMGVNPTVIIDSLLPGYAGNPAVIWLRLGSYDIETIR